MRAFALLIFTGGRYTHEQDTHLPDRPAIEKAYRPGMSMTNASLMQHLQAAANSLNQGQVDQARTHVQAVLGSYPNHPTALYLSGGICKLSGQLAEAEAFYRRSLKAAPKQPQVANALGAVLVAQARLEEACEAFARATKLEPKYLEAWINLGRQRLDMKALVEAEKAFRAALNVNPNEARGHVGLGRVYAARGEYDQARTAFEKAIALAPTYFHAHHYLGHALFELGQLEAAAERFDQALQLQPNVPATLQEAARVDFQLDRKDRAIARLRQAISLQPLNASLHRDLNQILFMLGHDDLLASFKQVLDQTPFDPGLLCAFAQFAVSARQPGEALAYLQRAAAMDNCPAEVFGALAHVVAETDRPQAALAWHEKARSLAPQNKFILQNYCSALFNTGEIERAAAIASDAFALDPTDQMNLAYQTTALRLQAEPQANGLYQPDIFTEKKAITPPPGYASLDAFNDAVRRELIALHNSAQEPFDQSLKGGTQVELTRIARQNKVIGELVDSLKRSVATFAAGLPDVPGHPFLSRKPEVIEFSGIWSVRLRTGGHHISHAHPEGWLSSCYYVDLPEDVESSGDHQGWLRIGEPPVGQIMDKLDSFDIQPSEGALILFPSYFWHGTLPFSKGAQRLTVAFDVKPRAV